MPRARIDLRNAEEVRLRQTTQQLRQIREFYRDLSKHIAKEINKHGKDRMQKAQLILIHRDIRKRLEQINEQISSGIQYSMVTTARAVKDDTLEFLKKIGFKDKDVAGAFAYVPDNVVRNILTGNVYKEHGGGNWSFSQAIWGEGQKVQRDINRVVSEGVAQGKSAYDVAKDLEKYVNPDARKDWEWSKVYPGTNKVVDYSAQRLARTLINHAYQQSVKAMNDANPFCTGYEWKTSNNHERVCDICKKRNGKVYEKDKLPLDHPNGMCVIIPAIPKTMTEIAREIGKWYRAPAGTYPKIDEYAKLFVNELDTL